MDFFRGVLISVPISIVLWIVIIWATLKLINGG